MQKLLNMLCLVGSYYKSYVGMKAEVYVKALP